jgi:hypothetical protein
MIKHKTKIQDQNDNNVKFIKKEEDQIYDLFAVVQHCGSLNGGHYTSVAKNKDVWYEFNDNFVKRLKKTDQKKIISCNAYILFY